VPAAVAGLGAYRIWGAHGAKVAACLFEVGLVTLVLRVETGSRPDADKRPGANNEAKKANWLSSRYHRCNQRNATKGEVSRDERDDTSGDRTAVRSGR
jgi:hypothetical protein